MAIHSNPPWQIHLDIRTSLSSLRDWMETEGFLVHLLSQGLSWSNTHDKARLNFSLAILNTSLFLYLPANHFLVPPKSWSPLNSKLSEVNKLPKFGSRGEWNSWSKKLRGLWGELLGHKGWDGLKMDVDLSRSIFSTYTDYLPPDLMSSIDPILKSLNKWHLLLINYSTGKRRYMLEECGALWE